MCTSATDTLVNAITSAASHTADKTGTLTEGRLRLASTAVASGAAAAVTDLLQTALQSSNGKQQQSSSNGSAAAGDDEVLLLRLAAAVEASTRHPLAAALAAEASSRGLRLPTVSEAKTEPGSGMLEPRTSVSCVCLLVIVFMHTLVIPILYHLVN